MIPLDSCAVSKLLSYCNVLHGNNSKYQAHILPKSVHLGFCNVHCCFQDVYSKTM